MQEESKSTCLTRSCNIESEGGMLAGLSNFRRTFACLLLAGWVAPRTQTSLGFRPGNETFEGNKKGASTHPSKSTYAPLVYLGTSFQITLNGDTGTLPVSSSLSVRVLPTLAIISLDGSSYVHHSGSSSSSSSLPRVMHPMATTTPATPFRFREKHSSSSSSSS